MAKTGINSGQLENLIERVLNTARLYSPSACELLLMTVAQESAGGIYIRQLGNGPAIGIFQMEPTTHDDIWENYLGYREELGNRILEMSRMDSGPDSAALEWNLAYAALMARAHYLRVPSPLPDANNVKGLAEYWKRHYNTPLGAGTVSEAMRSYERWRLA